VHEPAGVEVLGAGWEAEQDAALPGAGLDRADHVEEGAAPSRRLEASRYLAHGLPHRAVCRAAPRHVRAGMF